MIWSSIALLALSAAAVMSVIRVNSLENRIKHLEDAFEDVVFFWNEAMKDCKKP